MIVPVLFTYRSWINLDEQSKNDVSLRLVYPEVRRAELEQVIRTVHRISQGQP